MKTFKCSRCNNSYPWVLLGGLGKLIAHSAEHSIKNSHECAYCRGMYPDGTQCKGNSK